MQRKIIIIGFGITALAIIMIILSVTEYFQIPYKTQLRMSGFILLFIGIVTVIISRFLESKEKVPILYLVADENCPSCGKSFPNDQKICPQCMKDIIEKK